jgi:hypothetical protein
MALGTSYEVAKARDDYVRGHIEVDELERQLDALSTPEHLGDLGDDFPDIDCFRPRLTGAPGEVIQYNPVRHGTPHFSTDGELVWETNG